MSRRYLDEPLHLNAAAGELGLTEATGLTALFRLPRFRALGLMPLAGLTVSCGRCAAKTGSSL